MKTQFFTRWGNGGMSVKKEREKEGRAELEYYFTILGFEVQSVSQSVSQSVQSAALVKDAGPGNISFRTFDAFHAGDYSASVRRSPLSLSLSRRPRLTDFFVGE